MNDVEDSSDEPPGLEYDSSSECVEPEQSDGEQTDDKYERLLMKMREKVYEEAVKSAGIEGGGGGVTSQCGMGASNK